MRTLTALLSVLFLSAYPFVLLSAADEKETEKGEECATKTAVKVKDAVYDFQYDSWVRPNDDKSRFLFGRCILATKPRQMFVDWKETGVKGYTDPDDGKLQAGVQALTKESQSVATELWFGGKPKKTKSTYLAAKELKQDVAGGTLKSYARMSLGRKPEDRSEEVGAKTVKVNVEFEAAAFQIGDGNYLYTVSWRDQGAKDVPPGVRLRWPGDSVVTKALRYRATDEPWVHKKLLRPSPTAQGVHLIEKGPPVYSTVTVTFEDDEGKEIGSTSVSVFRPREASGR